MKKLLFFLFVFSILLVWHPTKVFAAACTASSTGNWNTSGTWSCGHVPTSADDVTISGGITITVDVASAVANSVAVTNTSSNGTGTLAVGANTLTVTTSVTQTSGNGQKKTTITVSGGTLTIGTNLTTDANSTFDLSGGTGSTVHLGGSFNNTGTFTAGTTSIFDYNGTTNQSVQMGITYANLYFNNTSLQGAVPNGNITTTNVLGDLRVQSGLLFMSNGSITGNATKTFQVDNGATVVFKVTGPTGFGTYTFGVSSTVEYQQGASNSVRALNYGNLEITPTSSSVTATIDAGTLSVAGNLTIGDGSNTDTITAATNSTTVTVTGSLTIAANATFVANGSNTTTVNGNWSNSGTFTHSNGTVALTGSSQIISGSSTFYNLSITGTTARTVTFTAGTTTAVSNSLTMTGASGQLLTLRSSSTSDWNLVMNGATQSISYVSVSHSNAGGGTQIDASNGTDVNGGNNTNWLFTSGITISGNAYADLGTTIWSGCDGSTARISLVINGGTASTTSCNASTGAYSFSSITVAANNPVSVFFNTNGSNTDMGVAVTVAANSSSNITLNVRKNVIWVTQESGVSQITNSNLTHCNSSTPAQCGNVPYSITSGNLTGNTGVAMVVASGKTYAPGGNITMDKLDIDGATFSPTSFTVTLSGSGTSSSCTSVSTMEPFCFSSATFNSATSTMNFTSITNTNVKGTTYYNLGVGTSADSSGVTYTLDGDTTVTHVLTVGNNNINNAATDTLSAASFTVTLSGSGTPLVVDSTWGAFSAGSSAINYTYTTTVGATVTLSPVTYYNLGVGTVSDSNSGMTYVLSGNTTSQNTVTVGNAGSTNSDTLDLSSYMLTLSGNGTPLNLTSHGALSSSTGTVAYTGSGAQSITPAIYYGLSITASSARTATFTSGSTYTVAANGTLTLTGSAGQLLTLAPNSTTDWNLNVNSTGTTVSVSYVSVSHSNAGGGKQIDASNGTNTDGGNNTNWLFVSAPTQIVFTTSARTLTAGTCSGAAQPFTIATENAGNTPTAPTGTTVVQVSSNSSNYTIYSDSSCNTQITSGNITFTTSDTSKTFYVVDTKKSSPTFTLTAAKTSGSDTLSNGTQTYTVNAGAVTRLVITLPGQTFTDGSGNSGSVTTQTAGTAFDINRISATDDYFNVNTGYTGAKTLTYSGPNNSPKGNTPSYTTSVSFASGQSTTTLATTLYKAETTNITVKEGTSYGYASSAVTVNPQTVSTAAADSTVTGPSTKTVNLGATITITLKDAYQNPVSSVPGTDINFTGTTATYTITSSPTDTDSSGVSTAVLKWSDTGAKTVTVAVNGVGTLSSTLSITITPATVQTQIKGGSHLRSGAAI